MCSITRCLFLYILLLGTIGAPMAMGATLWEDEESGERFVTLDTSLKLSALASHAPEDRFLFPDRNSEVGLFRCRWVLDAQLGPSANAELAYEHRAQRSSGAAGVGAVSSVLPSLATASYRLNQLDWQIDRDEDTFLYRHEIDRAFVALHPQWGEVTLGRQAIGLGRGVLFSAIDMFSPFSPTEVDREWRRGVDALRVEYRTTDTSSLELLFVADEQWKDSALLGRVRGYLGDWDGALLFGKRAEDEMLGGALSAILGDAEAHLELAVFHTPEEHPDGGLLGEDTLIPKAVLGASYTFDVGNGLTLLGEYHYSGFGLENVEDALTYLQRDAFQRRFLRGDSQILGRHAVAVQCTYPFNEIWTASALFLQSPADGSGIFSPAVLWDFAQNASLRMNAFLPWGPDPRRGRLQSEYGASPMSLFLQLSFYF